MTKGSLEGIAANPRPGPELRSVREAVADGDEPAASAGVPEPEEQGTQPRAGRNRRSATQPNNITNTSPIEYFIARPHASERIRSPVPAGDET